MPIFNIFELFGACFGISGALLLSSKLGSQRKWRLMAFICYFSSNIGWLLFSISLNAQGLMIMNVFFLLSSMNGIRNNWGQKQNNHD